MRKLSLLLSVLCLLTGTFLSAQSWDPCLSTGPYHIVVLGSSTAAGSGASTADSAWVNRYRKSLESLHPGNSVTNLAVGGYTSYRIMPTGFTPPPGRPAPATANNITQALSLSPDAIIVNLPSNDVSQGFSVAEQLWNLDTVVQISLAAGVPIWMATTQPKANFSPANDQKQVEVRDSIFARYGPFAIDFWTTLALPDSSLDPFYDSGDGTHLNDKGHALLESRVIGENIPAVLYNPPNYPDYLAGKISPQNPAVCGDSMLIVEVPVGNAGAAGTGNVQVFLRVKNLSTAQQDTLTQSLANPLNACTADTAVFTVNTWTAGYYQLAGWTADPADSNAANDTVFLNLHASGHPAIIAVDDTICNPGSVSLQVLTDPQDTVFWYDSLSGGQLIGVGNSYLTSWLATSETYYAEAVRGHLFYTGAISTTTNSNINWNGAMFDLVASAALTVDSFAVKVNTPGAQTLEIYRKAGSHLGSEQNAAAWTLEGADLVNVTDPNGLVTVHVGGFSMNAGDTAGIYVQLANPNSRLSYQSAGSPITRSNSEISIITGSGSSHNFGGNFYPRDWNGTVYYHHGFRPSGDCSTGRVPVEAVVSLISVSLGPDTIIDLDDTLQLNPGAGFAAYAWSTGSTAPTLSLAGQDLGQGIHFVIVTVTDAAGCTGSDTVIVAVADLVGETDVRPGACAVYPQPAGARVFVSVSGQRGEDLRLELWDLNGRKMLAVPVHAESKTEISLAGLPQGLYLYRIFAGDWPVFHGKLIRARSQN